MPPNKNNVEELKPHDPFNGVNMENFKPTKKTEVDNLDKEEKAITALSESQNFSTISKKVKEPMVRRTLLLYKSEDAIIRNTIEEAKKKKPDAVPPSNSDVARAALKYFDTLSQKEKVVMAMESRARGKN